MRTIFVYLVTAGVINIAQGQVTGIISGTTKDQTTQASLPGVSIILEGTDPLTGTVSDGRGGAVLMTAHTRQCLSRLHISYRAHRLHGHPLPVQRLQEQVHAGGNLEMR